MGLFHTPAVKQILQLRESSEWFGFLMLVRVMHTPYCSFRMYNSIVSKKMTYVPYLKILYC